MTEQSPNELFQNTSFLQGHNAQYVEQLYARYANDPHAVDESWRAFFETLGGDAPQGPSWARPDWPPVPGGELVAALDGQWGDDIDPKAAGDRPNISRPT